MTLLNNNDKEYQEKEILYARSGDEEHLYLLIRICSKCNKKGTFVDRLWTIIQDKNNKHLEKCSIECRNCGHQEVIYFNISSFFGEGESDMIKERIINKSENPSRIIDVVDYTNLSIFHFNILKKDLVKKDADEKRLNHFAKLARGCIKEALKFYGQSEALDESKSIFSPTHKKIYENDKEGYSFKYLKFQLSKINSFCNNLSTMKEIYSGLIGETKTDIKYLRNLREGKYKDNKEIIGEIARIEGPLIFKTLPPEAIKEWNELNKNQKPPWEMFEY